MRKRLLLVVLLVSLIALAGVGYWYSRIPILTVYLEPRIAQILDRQAYLEVFKEAGVQRLRLVESPPPGPLGAQGRDVSVALVLSPDRNPQLDAEMLKLGLTGPGYTDGYIGHVYQPDIELFVKKHQTKYTQAGVKDMEQVKLRLITNTAVHETWHAITQSTSHNPADMTSVMYDDPGKAAVPYGTQRMLFTRGHRERLRSLFLPEPLFSGSATHR